MPKNFKCKKCGISIGGHNQYLHDGMCNDCFFEVYFPGGAQIFEMDVKKIKTHCMTKPIEKENLKFRDFLKFGEFDRERFNRIVKEIEEKIDCTECGNCCRVLKPILDMGDVERISKHLKITNDDFIENYLMKNDNGNLEFKQKPCIFLVDNKCQIYEIRPEECRKYPHLDRDVTERCIQFFNNAEICPIVFNVLENAKEEFVEDIYAFENPDI